MRSGIREESKVMLLSTSIENPARFSRIEIFTMMGANEPRRLTYDRAAEIPVHKIPVAGKAALSARHHYQRRSDLVIKRLQK